MPHLLKTLADNLGYLEPQIVARIEALPYKHFQALCWDLHQIRSILDLEHWLTLSFQEQFLRRDMSPQTQRK
jgi:hypothetical protein